MSESGREGWVWVAGIGIAAAAAAIDAFLWEPARVRISRPDLSLPDLPPAWEGARVAQVTDVHYGNPRSEALCSWMVRTVNALEADLIVATGDFVLNRRAQAGPAAQCFARLRARHGILGVLGDHDYGGKPRRPLPGLVEALSAAGVRLLRNESIELPGGLRIAGTDPDAGKVRASDLAAALADLPPGTMPHLLLAHSPDIIIEAARREVPMVLCGHTHGGQVVLPFYGPPVTNTRVGRRHASGWSSRNGTRMYTCRGLSSHNSLRFLCPPEVALFTLRRG